MINNINVNIIILIIINMINNNNYYYYYLWLLLLLFMIVIIFFCACLYWISKRQSFGKFKFNSSKKDFLKKCT